MNPPAFAFGTCMNSCWPQVEALIRERVSQVSMFTYCEIGVYYGSSISWVSSLLHSILPREHWKAIGIDAKLELQSITDKLPTSLRENVKLREGESKVEIPKLQWPVDFCLLDGCHSCDCCLSDLELLEPKLGPGSILLVHDFDPAMKGSSSHCGKEAGVIEACERFGIAPECTRPGWERLPDLKAERGKNEFDFGVFKRVTAGTNG